jgi:hypothetical protein
MERHPLFLDKKIEFYIDASNPKFIWVIYTFLTTAIKIAQVYMFFLKLCWKPDMIE